MHDINFVMFVSPRLFYRTLGMFFPASAALFGILFF